MTSRSQNGVCAKVRRALGKLILVAVALWSGLSAALSQPHAEARHAIAMHGTPALPAGFPHFPYVNPEAPKGGRLTLAMLGTFDSLNPFIVNGLAPGEIRGYVVESLLARGYDEPFTLYGLLARTVETDDARSYVTFSIDPEARFSDGRPVTAEDVLFSWKLLRDHGRPNHRAYYSKVAKAEALDSRTVRFDFGDMPDRELPLILGLMPVLAKHATDVEAFEQTSFTAPLGSGPYVVSEVQPGEHFTLKRNPAYWGRERGVNRGLWNFDEIRFDYYRDANTQFEAFKKGLADVRAEPDPARWEAAYDVPAVQDGRIVKETFTTGAPQGMSGFVFNTRRAIFADMRVREALGLLFDAAWVNRNFYFGRYHRIASYFAGSELSSQGHAADARERALLAPFMRVVRPDILEGVWEPGAPDGSGRDRERLRRALDLLKQAGWEIQGTELRRRDSGKRFSFEILVATKDQERLALALERDLRRAGIAARVRLVDAVQYDRRRQTFDFDMIQNEWGASLSPGNEQSFYWGSAAADTEGSRNYMGAKSPAIDAMIAALLAARNRADFISAVRALDRVLLSGFYVIPLFYTSEQWVARWSHIRHPAKTSLHGYLPETWWREPPQ
ncbi:MAG TPA: extracellular solute-binding protein [Xanthobacteraceae bacterium]|nr:extracellular solute-binding protein [Xanthobacteraceae bacterium]